MSARARMIVAMLTGLMVSAASEVRAAPDAPPATRPAGRAARVRAERAKNADLATTRPATAPASQAHFPTPAELIAKMRQQKEKEDSKLKVAYFDLSRPVTEAPEGFSLFGGDSGMSLRSLLERLHRARDDKDLKAVLVTIESPQMNLSQAHELRDALVELTKAGKKTYVYADSYDTTSYTVASGASEICLLPGGEVMIPGVGLEATFAKGLLDKVGVKADYVQIGEYKGADESFTRTAPSEQLRGELNKLVDSLYDQIISGIAKHRNLSKDAVKQLVDEVALQGEAAKDRGLVDRLVDMDGLREMLTKDLGGEVNLMHDYGRPPRQEIDLSNPFAFFSLLTRKAPVSSRPSIAMIYAEGTIIDGEGGQNLLGGEVIGSKDIREAFRLASRDEKIKAIVLRIDSPGGSALASEAMWQAARRAAKDKPLVVSVGSMAASGGYYLASAGEYIIADPTGIVGSIGVVGGKFVTKDLFDKLGLTSEPFTRGSNADLFSSNQPFSERQRTMITSWMKQTYDLFTQRVMSTRQGKIDDIDKVARGRIFAAREAKALGMIDQLGGIEDAIHYAAGKASLEEGQYDIRVLPPAKTLADFFGGADQEAKLPAMIGPKVQVSSDSILRLLPASSRQTLGQHLQMLQLLEQRPVILATPWVVRVN